MRWSLYDSSRGRSARRCAGGVWSRCCRCHSWPGLSTSHVWGVKGLLTLRAVQAVPKPPDGDEVDGPLGHGLDLRAEPADVDVDRPHPPVVIGSPDPVEELAPAVRTSRMRGQQREQSELLRTQVDRARRPAGARVPRGRARGRRRRAARPPIRRAGGPSRRARRACRRAPTAGVAEVMRVVEPGCERGEPRIHRVRRGKVDRPHPGATPALARPRARASPGPRAAPSRRRSAVVPRAAWRGSGRDRPRHGSPSRGPRQGPGSPDRPPRARARMPARVPRAATSRGRGGWAREWDGTTTLRGSCPAVNGPFGSG